MTSEELFGVLGGVFCPGFWKSGLGKQQEHSPEPEILQLGGRQGWSKRVGF